MTHSKRITAILLFLVSVTATINLINCSVDTDALCIERERKALLSFKRSLDDSSNLLSSWDVAVDCCKWDRIICDNLTGNVLELHLQSLGLFLGLNPSLLHLKHLRFLDLSQNDFAITIPSFIGSLVNLEYLNLSYSKFHGIIPHHLGNLSNLRTLGLSEYKWLKVDSLHWLSGLSHLEHLDLSSINLSKMPDWLYIVNKLPNLIELHLSGCGLDHITPLSNANFSSLEVLDLSDNQFQSVVPNWIFSLSNLVSLQLQENNFGDPVPNASINLAKLRFLDLSYNKLYSAIPYWLFNCSNLEFLWLRHNFLHGSIPNTIANLIFLRSLDLSVNELSGKIPWQVGELCNLQELQLSFNKFQGNLESFGSSMAKCFLASLEILDLAGNSISGRLTERVGEFENIKTLDLGHNSFTGPIPVNLGSLSSLTKLLFDNNKLTGTVPLSFGQLSNLEVLVMEYNMLQGVVNENHFANLTKLTIIQASGNPLTLRVPEDWTPPFQLETIFLSSWNLGTQIPTWLRTQGSILDLDFSFTGISGQIPAWFWNMSAIEMNLSHNELSGKLPDINGPQWVYLSSNKFSGPLPFVSYSLMELDLSNNSLSGDLSHMLCSVTNQANSLTILHLGGNQLSGKIPDCWTNWPSLEVINLGKNFLHGSIPRSLGVLGSLKSLNFYENALSGEISSSVQNCTSLIKLDLSGNEFEGNVPPWIRTSLSKLRILILRSNKFTGEITSDICSLSFLHVMDLADNKFSGEVPRCLDNLTVVASQKKLENFSGPTYYSYLTGVFMESAFVTTKGSEFQYDTILSLFSSIDLSDNVLSGPVPKELTSLSGLISLNLSGNHLTGLIPNNIGEMRLLESLDLSRNQLTGEIPLSITSLDFLSYLNVSFNNLSGRIPDSTQLHTFTSSSFVGNELCGFPLSANCTVDDEGPCSKTEAEDEDPKAETDWFYVLMAVGFAVGFWGTCGTLIFKRSWRFAYFRFMDDVWYKVCASSNFISI